MSAPSPRKGRGRGEAREELVVPEHVWHLPVRRPIQPGESDPARTRWIELLLRDPAAARRERLEARLAYWRGRLRKLEERLAAAEQAVHEALNPSPEDGPAPPVPAVVIWELQAAVAAAWADVQAARAQVEALERELRQ